MNMMTTSGVVALYLSLLYGMDINLERAMEASEAVLMPLQTKFTILLVFGLFFLVVGARIHERGK